MGFFPNTCAVFAMYRDKDAAGVIAAMKARIDRWFIAPLPGPRGGSAAELAEALQKAGVAPASIIVSASVEAAFHAAWEQAGDADRIAAFGSFLTVAAVLAARGAANRSEA